MANRERRAPTSTHRTGRSKLTLTIIVGLIVAILLLLAFSRLVSVGAVFQRLRHLSPLYVVLCGVAFLSAYTVRGLRWRWFLTPVAVSRTEAVAIYQLATFVNWLVPVRGGELVKCLMLRRLHAIPVSRSLPTVTMDKAMDLLPALVLWLVLPFTGVHLDRLLWLLLLSVVALLACGGLALILAAWQREFSRHLLSRLLTPFPAVVRRTLEPFLARFMEALLALVKRPGVLLIASLYTGVAVCLDALFCLLAFRAVGLALPYSLVLFGFTFYNLSFILPTPPGGVGSVELVGLAVFSGLLGVNRSAVAAMYLFTHVWTAALMTGSALLALGLMGVSVRSAWHLAQPGDTVTAADPLEFVPGLGSTAP